jgi:hypothetical protein
MVQILIIGNGFTGREDECFCLLSIAFEISFLKRFVVFVAPLSLYLECMSTGSTKNIISP